MTSSNLPSPLLSQQMDAIAEADGEIGVAVVVEIARGAAETAAGRAIPAGCVTSAKRPSPRLCSRRLVPSARRADEEEIGLAVAVVVDEAGAGAWAERCSAAACGSCDTGCSLNVTVIAAGATLPDCAQVPRANSGPDRRSPRRMACRDVRW